MILSGKSLSVCHRVHLRIHRLACIYLMAGVSEGRSCEDRKDDRKAIAQKRFVPPTPRYGVGGFGVYS